MCSPVGHSLFGLIIYYLTNKKFNIIKYWKIPLIFIILSNLPDIDLLPMLWGNMDLANSWHHIYTHTIGFSIIVSLLFFLVLQKDRIKISIIVFLLIFSHIILDFLTIDSRYPFGVMLFWPFTLKYFHAFNPIFLPLKKGTISSLFTLHNVWTATDEILKFGSVLLILLIFRFRQERKNKVE